jgi:hypothetical protein
MALLDNNLLGVFNDHSSDLQETTLRAPSNRGVASLPSQGDLELQQSSGLDTGGIKAFPYADLIREHLGQGRILAARNLLEFARDLIPPDSKLVKALAPPRIKKSDRLDVDRSAEFRWLQANSSRFQGQWVALAGDSLVTSAATLAELLAELKANPPSSRPLIHHLD